MTMLSPRVSNISKYFKNDEKTKLYLDAGRYTENWNVRFGRKPSLTYLLTMMWIIKKRLHEKVKKKKNTY